jgi:hypothetical protein
MRIFVSPRFALVSIAVLTLAVLAGGVAPLHATCSCPTAGFLTESGDLTQNTDCTSTDHNLQFNLTSFAEANCEAYSSTICWSEFVVTYACEQRPDGTTNEGGTVRYRCLECLTDE